MSSSASMHANLGHRELLWNQKRLASGTAHSHKGSALWVVRAVLDNRRKSVIRDGGATEPARVVLERLFAQTQKLEQQIGRDPDHPQAAELGLNLGMLESDLQSALAALKKKEEDLQDAERKVLHEFNDLNHAKEELEWREEKLTAATAKQENLEEELRKANLVLASQARIIEDLKLSLKEKNQEIFVAESSLSFKEDEVNKLKNELIKMEEEVFNAESELRSKGRLLDETDKIVGNQKVELQELRRVIQEKEAELKASVAMQKIDADKLKVAEAALEKQTLDWLVVQEELKRLAVISSKSSLEANNTLEEFRRVKKLLAEVRSELLSSQEALAFFREKIGKQESLLENQQIELEEQRKSVASYLRNLKDAEIEVEAERVKVRIAEARNKELERELSLGKDVVLDLRKELDRGRSTLEEALQGKSFLQQELVRKATEFEETQNALQVKESELVEARLEIHHLKSAQASLHHMLAEKDLELLNAKDALEKVNQEIIELRFLMNSTEEQLIQATTMLKERDEHVNIVQRELSDTKLKCFEAENAVERIVELTNKLVASVKNESDDVLNPTVDAHDKIQPQLLEESADDSKWRMKQLETELEFTKENLRAKEMEVLNVERVLTVKNEELKLVLDKLDAREKELGKMKEDVERDKDDLRQIYALAQERVGEKSIGELAIEKLQLEAAQLDVEAATSSLHKLLELSRDLLNKTSLSIIADYDISVLPDNMVDTTKDDDCLAQVQTEVARLSALTEKLVKEAGIVQYK